MLRSCLIVIRWSCLGSCAALWNDRCDRVVECWAQASGVVWCAAELGRRATVNRHGLRLVLTPGRKLLLLSARLSSGVPRSTRHRGRAVWRCFLADVLDGCFLICVWQSTPSDWFFGQAKVLTGGGDLREAQVDVPLSVSHSCVWPHRWAL